MIRILRRFNPYILFGVYILFLLAIIFPTFRAYQREAEKYGQDLIVRTPNTTIPGVLYIEGKVVSVDFNNANFKVHFDFDPNEGLETQDNFFARNVTINWGVSLTKFPADQPAISTDITFPFVDGDLSKYPFDSWKSSIYIIATQDKAYLPVDLTLYGTIQTLKFQPTHRLEAGNFITIDVKVKRSSSTIGFSIFVIVTMWLITLAVSILTYKAITKQFKVEPPIFVWPGTLLFALPAFRNTQPGVPSPGTSGDVMGFFWNMGIVAFSLLILVGLWLKRWKHQPAPAENEEKFELIAKGPTSPEHTVEIREERPDTQKQPSRVV
ncbi:uncharacterized protein VTP21DRAFT_4064 [Calcarisporiella thermophila]|uniref:uncharacterized protein n=1 Tax=Calcarisporiella thermophila TaxID=911321 RepID=UPI0037430026